MMTSHYGNLKLITPPLQPVSISRGKPRWLKGGWLRHCCPGTTGRNYDALAPSAAALKGTDAEYDRHFAALLRGLDPHQVYAELGEQAVLLCFCEPGVFCHRRLVAEWIEHHLGVLVPELGVDRIDTPMCVTRAYDFFVGVDRKYEWLEKQLGLPRGSSK